MSCVSSIKVMHSVIILGKIGEMLKFSDGNGERKVVGIAIALSQFEFQR